jgi:CHAT domain-containing protein
MLLGPVAQKISGKRLVISGDGLLQYVPFAALINPAVPARPLSASHEIVRLPSASVLAAVRRETATRGRAPLAAAVFADPVYHSGDPRVRAKVGTSAPPADAEIARSAADLQITSFGLRVPRLFFTRSEAESIASLASPGSVRVKLDFDASRNSVLTPGLNRFRFVHFATHALVNNIHPELSGIVLSLVDRKGSYQDGFLRLHDIYNLDLASDLVVVSACESGLGKEVRGEGLVGFTRGFLYAGAPRVLVSLWRVNDRATAALMRHFYRGIFSARMRPAAALRAAQAAMRRDPRWRSPYYWAGFVLQGEWR